jgi:hypothetical protein
MRRSSRPAAGRRSPGELFARRAPRAALRPSGPRRRRRAPGPEPTAAGGPPQSQRPARALQELPSSRRSSIEPRKITIKSAPPARPADGASATLDTDLPRLVRRLSGGRLRLAIAPHRETTPFEIFYGNTAIFPKSTTELFGQIASVTI